MELSGTGRRCSLKTSEGLSALSSEPRDGGQGGSEQAANGRRAWRGGAAGTGAAHRPRPGGFWGVGGDEAFYFLFYRFKNI